MVLRDRGVKSNGLGATDAVSLLEAVDILRKWQSEGNWVAVAIENNLSLTRCGGYLSEVQPSTVMLRRHKAHVTLTLTDKAELEWRDIRGTDEYAQQFDSALTIRMGEHLCVLCAFKGEPEELPMLI